MYAARDARGVRFTTVGGATAVYTTTPDGWGTLDWVRDGVRYTVLADGGLDRVRALAGRVVPVGLDDPRLVGVPDLRSVADLGH